ncbi:MAG TPA: uroporphyrinogen-III synthase [Terriglobales bacterium]|jgi:uroporphyrinogen-III synthase
MPAKQSLKGLRILVGRARHQASVLSAELRALGAEVVEIPFIEIRRPRSYKRLDQALKNLCDYDWLILTSVNGVSAVWERLRKLGIRKSSLASFSLASLKIAAIGPSTKKAIENYGLKVDVTPSEYVAEAVAKALRNKVNGKRVLLARAKVARDVIPQELKKAGAIVDVVEAYETIMPVTSRKRLKKLLADPKRKPDVITYTSSSTVKNFLALLGADSKLKLKLTRIQIASIGPITSATLREKRMRVDIEAEKYTIPGLVEAIVKAQKLPKQKNTKKDYAKKKKK